MRVGDANGLALLRHRGVLGGCPCVHIISRAGHGAQRVNNWVDKAYAPTPASCGDVPV